MIERDEESETSDSPLEAYDRRVRIGEGTYGVVYKAYDRQTGDQIALKRIMLTYAFCLSLCLSSFILLYRFCDIQPPGRSPFNDHQRNFSFERTRPFVYCQIARRRQQQTCTVFGLWIFGHGPQEIDANEPRTFRKRLDKSILSFYFIVSYKLYIFLYKFPELHVQIAERLEILPFALYIPPRFETGKFTDRYEREYQIGRFWIGASLRTARDQHVHARSRHPLVPSTRNLIRF